MIDIPRWKRELLVRFFIVPKRIKQTAKSYQEIWTDEGSPLLFWGKKVAAGTPVSFRRHFHDSACDALSVPAIQDELEKLKKCQRLIIVPLFPQYASATTGSIFESVMKKLSSWGTFPSVHMLSATLTIKR